MACNMLQRMCAQLVNNKDIEVSVYPEENIRVINTVSFEIDLLRKNTTGKVFLLSLNRFLTSSLSMLIATS